MRSTIVILTLVASVIAEAPYHLPRPSIPFPPAPAPPPPPPHHHHHHHHAPPPPPPSVQYRPQPIIQPAPQQYAQNGGYQYQPPTFIQQAPQPQLQYQIPRAPLPIQIQPQPVYQPAPIQIQPQPQPIYQPAPQPQTIYQPAPQPQPIYQPAPQPIYQPAPQPIPQPIPQPQPQFFQPPSTSYGVPQIRAQPQIQVQSQPIQIQPQPIQIQPQPIPSYIAPQPLPRPQPLPVFQSQPQQIQISAQPQVSLSSYQADSNQYSSGSAHAALDSVVVNQVQNVIKESEHTSARDNGYVSLVSGVSLENAQPSIEVSSFTHTTPLNIGGSVSSSSAVSAPSADYGTPLITSISSEQSSGSASLSFLPQNKPAIAYGPPNKK